MEIEQIIIYEENDYRISYINGIIYLEKYDYELLAQQFYTTLTEALLYIAKYN